MNFNIGDVFIVNSKLKSLETVKIKKLLKNGHVKCEVIEGSPRYVGDDIVLNYTSDFAQFVYNDDTRGWFRKFLDKVFV